MRRAPIVPWQQGLAVEGEGPTALAGSSLHARVETRLLVARRCLRREADHRGGHSSPSTSGRARVSTRRPGAAERAVSCVTRTIVVYAPHDAIHLSLEHGPAGNAQLSSPAIGSAAAGGVATRMGQRSHLHHERLLPILPARVVGDGNHHEALPLRLCVAEG